jgi:hypothetical protein
MVQSKRDARENLRRYRKEIERIRDHEEVGCCGGDLEGAIIEAGQRFAPVCPEAQVDLERYLEA